MPVLSVWALAAVFSWTTTVATQTKAPHCHWYKWKPEANSVWSRKSESPSFRSEFTTGTPDQVVLPNGKVREAAWTLMAAVHVNISEIVKSVALLPFMSDWLIKTHRALTSLSPSTCCRSVVLPAWMASPFWGAMSVFLAFPTFTMGMHLNWEWCHFEANGLLQMKHFVRSFLWGCKFNKSTPNF